MIFTTVGTHEQPFDRLLTQLDLLIADTKEAAIVQSGYCTYQPLHCQATPFLPFADMQRYMKAARIVVTHGGPASFLQAIEAGKLPIVVPRISKFGEHVNDHQLAFAKQVEARLHNIIVVEDIHQLAATIRDYEQLVAERPVRSATHNLAFNTQFAAMIAEMGRPS